MNLICKITDNDIGEKFIEMENPEIRLGARGIVFSSDGKIAILYKANKNEYKLPGGGIENEENPKEAFKREVLEETGCIVEIIKELGVTEEYKSQTNFKQISNVFVGKVIQDTKQLNITQKEKDEGAVLLWETPEKALELITDCFGKLVASDYDSVYATKFVVLRDIKILEYYIKNKTHSFFKFLFKLSLLYYIYWLIVSIKYSITGISSEYVGIHIESLCNHIHTTYYGFEGFCAGIENFIIFTVCVFWLIPLYQAIYIIINIVNCIRKKSKK